MTWLLNLRTRGKLFVVYGAMIALMAIIIAAAYTGISAIRESQRRINDEDFANALDLAKLRAEQNAVRVAVLSMMAATRQSDRDAWHADIQRGAKEGTLLLQQLRERNRDQPAISRGLDVIQRARDAFVRTRDVDIIPLIQAGNIEQARALALGVQAGESTRVLAEAAARNLHELGQQLKQLASHYTV